ESGGNPALNGNGTLDVGETWTYIATGAWAPGQHSDTATATDSYLGATVSASDGASFTGVTPGVTIDKQISADVPKCLDMGPGPLDSRTVRAGWTVHYGAIVTNTGALRQTVSVTDNPAATVTFNGGNASVTLAAGGSATSDAWTATVVAGPQQDT